MGEPLLIIVGKVPDSENFHIDLLHDKVVLIQISPFFFPKELFSLHFLDYFFDPNFDDDLYQTHNLIESSHKVIVYIFEFLSKPSSCEPDFLSVMILFLNGSIFL